MQAWDQVKVIAGEFEGQAGLVQSIEDESAMVKLDNQDEPEIIDIADLQFLGR